MVRRRRHRPPSDTHSAKLAALVTSYGPVLLRYLVTRTQNEAEARDLAQEAYLRLSRVPNPDLIQKPEAYLFRIAANLANEHILKRSLNKNALSLDQLQDIGGDGDGHAFEASLEARSAIRKLEAILADMPPLYRAILLLRKRDGLSHAEIAEELNISKHTVHRYLTKALAMCRSEWTE